MIDRQAKALRDFHQCGGAAAQVMVKIKRANRKTMRMIGVILCSGTWACNAGDFIANRKTDHDEFTLKGSGLYASTKRDPDTEKWYGMIRYAYNFWEQKLYNFYKFESDHDKFSNVYVRLLPSAGIGYWFSKERAFKGLLELAVGYENTYFMDDSSAKTEIVLVPRFFAEARLFGDATLSQDLVFYPSLNYFGDYRLQSETSLKNPLSEKLFLRLSLIDNYNSNPEKTGTLKNDLQFLTTLGYKY